MSETLAGIKSRFENESRRLGKDILSTIYDDIPNSRLIQLELTDSNFQTVQLFTFPVMPNSLIEEQTSITNIKKSLGGTISISNDSFVPTTITMSGTFGRSFSIVINDKPFEFAGVRLSFQDRKLSAKFNKEKPQFASFAKTGFGCTQILEELYHQHNELDDTGRPYYLILYAGPRGKDYIVKMNSISIQENDSQYNMMPQYTATFTTLAEYDINIFTDPKKVLKQLGRRSIQRGLNEIANSVKRSLRF